jgi:hypothetical protein
MSEPLTDVPMGKYPPPPRLPDRDMLILALDVLGWVNGYLCALGKDEETEHVADFTTGLVLHLREHPEDGNG